MARRKTGPLTDFETLRTTSMTSVSGREMWVQSSCVIDNFGTIRRLVAEPSVFYTVYSSVHPLPTAIITRAHTVYLQRRNRVTWLDIKKDVPEMPHNMNMLHSKHRAYIFGTY